MGGSHGKMKYLKITTVYILNTTTNVSRSKSIKYDEKLGASSGHDQVPDTTKDQAMAIAADYVKLGDNEIITDVAFKNRTAK